MIKVKNLHKKFGGLTVLNGIDEHISQGEVVVVIGPSGSGKSTFLRCLNLLEDVTDGEIYVDDQLINTCYSFHLAFHIFSDQPCQARQLER